MITKTKISPSVAAVRPRVHAGAWLLGGFTCAADLRVEGTRVSSDGIDGLGIRPTYAPTMQAFHVGDRAWSPPV